MSILYILGFPSQFLNLKLFCIILFFSIFFLFKLIFELFTLLIFNIFDLYSMILQGLIQFLNSVNLRIHSF